MAQQSSAQPEPIIGYGKGAEQIQPSGPGLADNFVDEAAQDIQALAVQAKTMQGSAGNLVQAAGTGFHLTPEAAATLIKACDDALDELEVAGSHAAFLRSPPALGSLHGAQQVSQFTQSVATDGRGMLDGLDSLRATLVQMRQAYQQASTNYQETEQRIADMLKAQMPDSGPVNDGSSWSQ